MSSRLYKILLSLGILACLIAVLIFYFYENRDSAEKFLEIDFLDVGQGDSILIKTPYDQNILVDGGPDDLVLEELGKNMPWWDRQIDLMILTHPHDDHVSGLIDALKRYQVEKVLYTGVTHDSPNYIAWLEIIRDRNTPLSLIEKSQVINLGADCYLDIIFPRESLAGKSVSNLNNSSIVFKLVYKNKSFLFTGDIETEIEKELVEKKDLSLNADVLKVGHHGSDTSSTENFLSAISPSIAVISVGVDNDFGHPSLRILKRLKRAGAEIYRTDLDGTIKLMSDGERIWIKKID